VPVVAHLGSRPQMVRAKGGYSSVGRPRAEADQVVDVARLMIERGAAMILLEAVPAEVGTRVVELANKPAGRKGPIPVIGCGAGPLCHGHVVVLHDLLGLTEWQPPFITPMATMGEQLRDAAARWAERVRSGEYLKHDHPYKIEG